MIKYAPVFIASHLLGDFPLQPDWMANRKTSDYRVLTLHVGVHMALLSAFLFVLTSIPAVDLLLLTTLTGVVHAVVDHRRWVSPKESWASPIMWVWLNDQIFHYVSIVLILGLY